jgi:2-furoyl-CoA dehydrogenase large subunit
VTLSDLDPPRAVTLSGRMEGNLGFGGGAGRITLTPDGNNGTALTYNYDAFVGGKVASVGGRLLDGATKFIIGQFFAALTRKVSGPAASPQVGLTARLLRQLSALFGRRAR